MKKINKGFWKIKFQGKFYYLCSSNKKEGPIATKYQYKNGYESYAYLYEDGRVMRHHTQIGTIKDIKFIKKEELNFKPIAFLNILSGNGWNF